MDLLLPSFYFHFLIFFNFFNFFALGLKGLLAKISCSILGFNFILTVNHIQEAVNHEIRMRERDILLDPDREAAERYIQAWRERELSWHLEMHGGNKGL